MRVRRSGERQNWGIFAGKFPSIKLDRTVHWQSQLERDYIYLLEFDRDVLFYEEHPSLKTLDCSGLPSPYTPNFFVQRSDNKQVVEVRAESHLAGEAISDPHRHVRLACRQAGYDFVVATDTVIREQPRLDNVKLLWRYARTTITVRSEILCRDFVRGRGEVSLGEVAEFFNASGIGVQSLYALMFRGVLAFDLTRPIASNTGLRLSFADAIERKAS